MGDLELGQPVTFTHTLVRESGPLQDGRYGKRWQPTPLDAQTPARRGVVVGVRTLADGRVVSGGFWEPGEWNGARYFRAYLVAYDLRRKPVLVLPEHLKGADRG